MIERFFGSGKSLTEYCEALDDGYKLAEIFLSQQNKTTVNQQWKEHSAIITLFILDAIQLLRKHEKVVVLGAGNCSDINISILATHFEKIFLVDIDTEAANGAVEKVPEEFRKKIDVINEDLTGLYSSRVMKDLIDSIQRKNIKRINRSLNNIKSEVKHLPRPLSHLNSTCDLVISSCVSSQFFMPLFIAMCDGLNRKIFNEIYPTAVTVANSLASRYLELMYNIIGPAGYLVFIADIFEWSNYDGKLSPFAEVFRNHSIINSDIIKDTILNRPDLRIAGGFPKNTADYFNPVINGYIVNSRQWWWEFSPQKRYLVQGHLLEPKKS